MWGENKRSGERWREDLSWGGVHFGGGNRTRAEERRALKATERATKLRQAQGEDQARESVCERTEQAREGELEGETAHCE